MQLQKGSARHRKASSLSPEIALTHPDEIDDELSNYIEDFLLSYDSYAWRTKVNPQTELPLYTFKKCDDL